MGDTADLMLDGTLCEGCGVYLEDSLGSFPQRCLYCQQQDRLDRITCGAIKTALTMKVSCPTCGKRVRVSGLADHQRAVHPT